MADCILADDDTSVLEAGRDVMAEVAVDRRQHLHTFRHTGDGAEQIDTGLETAREQAGAAQEHVADGGRLEVEDVARRTGPFDDLEVEVVQERPDHLLLRGRDVVPERRPRLDDLEPFQPRCLR